jgi:hypothetical protein
MSCLRRFFSLFYVGWNMFDEAADGIWDRACAECAEKGRTE